MRSAIKEAARRFSADKTGVEEHPDFGFEVGDLGGRLDSLGRERAFAWG